MLQNDTQNDAKKYKKQRRYVNEIYDMRHLWVIRHMAQTLLI